MKSLCRINNSLAFLTSDQICSFPDVRKLRVIGRSQNIKSSENSCSHAVLAALLGFNSDVYRESKQFVTRLKS